MGPSECFIPVCAWNTYNERLDGSCVHVGWIGVVSGFIRILQTTPGLHPSEQDPNKWPNSNDQRTKFIFSVKNESYWSVQKEHWEHGAVPLTFEFKLLAPRYLILVLDNHYLLSLVKILLARIMSFGLKLNKLQNDVFVSFFTTNDPNGVKLLL